MGTSLTVSRLSFGTGSLHHLFRRSDRLRVLEAALEAGITHFDTSPYYGFGLAEIDLGFFLSTNRDQVTVTSKVGLYAPGSDRPNAVSVWGRKILGKVSPSFNRAVVDWSIETAERSLNRTLKRLKTDYIDFLMLHEPDVKMMQTAELMDWLTRKRDGGQIRYWGLAGAANLVSQCLSLCPEMADVIQTRDSLNSREADFVTAAGRDFQFTYGYMQAVSAGERTPDIYRQALRQNVTGSVIISTRHESRLAEAVRAVG